MTMQIATLLLAGGAFACSAATLAVVLKGGTKMKADMEQTKKKFNRSLNNLKSALDNLEF